MQIATPWVHINRWEAVSILMESPTWQLNNNHKLLVAGFCLDQKKKKKCSQRLLSLLFIKKLDKYSSVSVVPLEFIASFLTSLGGVTVSKAMSRFCLDWRNPESLPRWEAQGFLTVFLVWGGHRPNPPPARPVASPGLPGAAQASAHVCNLFREAC